MDLQQLGEFGLIQRIKEIVQVSAEDIIAGIGDDCAVLRTANDQTLLLSTDTLIEGVHFNLSYFTFYDLGWRAMAVNLSDIAAMGGWPSFVLVALGLPRTLQVESVEELYRGMKALTDKYQVAIIGGDTTRAPDRLYLSLAVIGQAAARQVACRSNAKVGDALFVTGTLGAACAGLKVLTAADASLVEKFPAAVHKHLKPEPRLNEARFLVEQFSLHAMIDISDGLAAEVHHICASSRVGAVLFEQNIPLDQDTRAIAELLGETSSEYALNGGEDFELLFSARETDGQKLATLFQEKFGMACTQIGKVVEEPAGISLKRTSGQRIPLQDKGYDHFRS